MNIHFQYPLPIKNYHLIYNSFCLYLWYGSDDIILNAVVGGVLSGIGVGVSLKWGASTGGMDIVAMILSRLQDKPIGIYFLILNAMIIAVAGILYDPENALYTMISLYITTIVIDSIHTRHEKVTVLIVTRKPVR